MNKTIGKMLRVALFAVPLALPGAALAQSAGGTPSDTQQQMNPPPSGQEAPAPQGTEGSKDTGTMGTETQAPPPGTSDTTKKKEKEKKHKGSSGEMPQGQQY